MKNSRLENAAAAAGFAMVNPDDFARETPMVADVQQANEQYQPFTQQPTKPLAARSWLSWDYLRLVGAKATA